MRRGISGLSSRVIDAGGQRLSRQRAEEVRAVRERERDFERSRPQTKVPLLTTLVQVEQFVEGEPAMPIVSVAKELPIRELGKAIFGPEGYNRIKRVSKQPDAGAHFDAYAGRFSPWTLHENDQSRGVMRACFLPDEMWQAYIEKMNGLSESSLTEIAGVNRRMTGHAVMKAADMLYINPIGPGTRTLIWHGRSEPGSTPPSVHDVYRDGITIGGVKANESFTLYAQQLVPGNFQGFVEV